MAYTPNTLSELYGGPIEGGFKQWIYTTADAITTVLAAGYFAAGASGPGNMGMAVGDLIWVINQTSPASAPATQVQCTAVATTTSSGLTLPTGAVTVQQTGLTTLGLSNNPRNIVDGGDFGTNPWQGGTTFSNIGTSTVLTADRWNAIGGTGAVAGVTRVAHTDVAGFSQALRWGRSSTDTHTTGLSLGQVMESADSIRLQGLPVSLSFWAQAGSSFAAGASGGTFSAIVVASTGTDDTFANLAAGSWTTASNVISTAVTPSTTTTRFGPFTGIVPTAATQLGLVFTYTPAGGTTAGTTETLDLLGVQLEAGGMTSFEHLDVAEVVSICQRYFVQLNEGTTGVQTAMGQALTTSTANLVVFLPTTMRKAPTVSVTIGGFAVTGTSGTALGITAQASAAATHTPQVVGLTVTSAAGMTAGGATTLVGRTTGSGKIVINADY